MCFPSRNVQSVGTASAKEAVPSFCHTPNPEQMQRAVFWAFKHSQQGKNPCSTDLDHNRWTSGNVLTQN